MAQTPEYIGASISENTVDQKYRDGRQTQIIPKELGAYKIESVLGEGGVATVYKAMMQNRPVALKILDRQAASHKSVRDGFRREFRTTSRLSHPNIIRSLDTGEMNGQFYIAMELVDGETFDEFLRRHKSISEVAAIGIISQVAESLHYLHEQGIVHRDIKPSNIMLTRNNQAKLFDFGASLDLNNVEPESLQGVYGTLGYVSPEQAKAAPDVDGRADIYGLGVVLYRAVTGQKPFYGTRDEVMKAHVEEPPAPPSKFTRISPDLEAIILRCLQKDPADRFQTGHSLAEALRNVAILPPLEPLAQRAKRWLGINN